MAILNTACEVKTDTVLALRVPLPRQFLKREMVTWLFPSRSDLVELHDNCRSVCRIRPMNDRHMTVVTRHGVWMQKWYCKSVKYFFYLVILVMEMLYNHVTNVWNRIVCFVLCAVCCKIVSCAVKVIRNLEWKKQNVASFCFVLWISQVSLNLLA